MVKIIVLFLKVLLLYIILAILISGCIISTQKSPIQATSVISTPFIIVQNSAIVYTTMEEITTRADLIIDGQAISEDGIINSYRDPNDPSKPDPTYFSIGQAFTIKVNRYIKGEGPSYLNLVLNQGHVDKSLSELSTSDIEQAMIDQNILPLPLNQRYIMFLRFVSDNYIDFSGDIYTGLAHPWRFEVTTTDCVQPVDKEADLYRYFPSQSLNDFIESVNNPAMYPGLSYPPPLAPSRCPAMDKSPYPYP